MVELQGLCYTLPMSISLDEVRHVARLARLELAESEILSLQGELNALLGHFSDLSQAQLDGLEASSHLLNVSNVWSEDQPRQGISQRLALRNAPVSKAGLFVVPMIIEE